MSKIQIVKELYGGDAQSINQLSVGDCLIIRLLEKAVSLLLKKKKYLDYFNDSERSQDFEISIPTNQLSNLKMNDCSLMFYRFFSSVTIHQIVDDNKVVKTIVKSGTKQINIYTMRD